MQWLMPACAGLLVSIGAVSAGADDSTRNLYGRAVRLFSDGNDHDAHDLLTRAIEAGTRDPRVLYFRGLAARNLKRDRDADADLREAARREVELDVTDEVNRALERVQGESRVWIERYRRNARNEMRLDNAGRDLTPTLRSLYGEGLRALKRRDLPQALQLFTQTIDGGSRDPRFFYYRGIVHSELGDDETARGDFVRAAELEAENRATAGVGRALERVQGAVRQTIESIRTKVVPTVNEQIRIAAREASNDGARPLAPTADAPIPESSLPRTTTPPPRPVPAATARAAPSKEPSDTSIVSAVPSRDPSDTSTARAAPSTDPPETSVATTPADDIDLSWLSPDTEVVIAVKVSDIWSSPLLDSVRSSPQMQAGLQEMTAALGFGPEALHSIIVGIRDASELAEKFDPGSGALAQLELGISHPLIAVIRSTEPIDREKLFAEAAKEYPGFDADGVEYRGHTYYQLDPKDPQAGAQCAFFADPTTFVVAEEMELRTVLDRGPTAPQRVDLGFAGTDQHLVFAFVPKDPSALMAQVPPPDDNVPPSVKAVWEAASGAVTALALGVRLTDDLDLKFMLAANDADASTGLHAALEQALAEFGVMFDLVREQMPPALVEPVTQIVKSISMESSDSTVAVSLTIPASIKDALERSPELLLPMMMGF